MLERAADRRPTGSGAHVWAAMARPHVTRGGLNESRASRRTVSVGATSGRPSRPTLPAASGSVLIFEESVGPVRRGGG